MPRLPPLTADAPVAPNTLTQTIRDGDHPFDWSPIKQDPDRADWVDSPLKLQRITLDSVYVRRHQPPLAEILPESHTVELDGRTDTHETIVLWVAGLQLVVAGDVVYSDVHQHLVEANAKELRLEWVAGAGDGAGGSHEVGWPLTLVVVALRMCMRVLFASGTFRL